MVLVQCSAGVVGEEGHSAGQHFLSWSSSEPCGGGTCTEAREFARIALGARGTRREGILVREGCLGKWRVPSLERQGNWPRGLWDSGEEDGEFWAGRGNRAPRPPATPWLPCALWWSLLGTQLSGHLCSDAAHGPLTLAGWPAVLLEVSCLPRHVPGTAPRDSALALASWWRQTADLTTLAEP